MTPSKLTLTLVPVLTVLALLQGCTTLPAPAPETPPQLDAKAQAKCAALAGTVIPGAALTLPGIGSGPATIDSGVYTRFLQGAGTHRAGGPDRAEHQLPGEPA
jgi:hypothetical protein